MGSNRESPVARKAARDSAAAEARFQSGRSAALASMNAPPPRPSTLQSAIKFIAGLFGANPAAKALDKAGK